jgi:hypothetical protein
MWRKVAYYRSASIAAAVLGSLSAVSQGASAAAVSITDEVFTGNAPLMSVETPVASSGNFEQSVTGGDTPAPSGMGTGGRLSPYAFNTGAGPAGGTAATNAPYSVLGDGTKGGIPIGTAIYNINAPTADLLWGSPDPQNEVTFFSEPGGMGTSLGSFNGTDLACFISSCHQTSFDLVTFAASSGDIGSLVVSNSINGMGSGSAFEFGGPDPVPVPGAIYLFGSVLGGAFWLVRRKRRAVSTLSAA